MTTAEQLIEAGYARSTANDPGKLATDAELLDRLNRNYALVYALAARQRPDEFASVVTITLVGASASYALPVDLIELRRIQYPNPLPPYAGGATVHLIPAAEITRVYHTAPCMFRTGSTIYSRLAPGDPVGGDVLNAWMLLSGATLSTLASTIDAVFPMRHTLLLVNDLALYLDAKDEDRDPEQFRKLAADQGMRVAAFAAEYHLAASALEFLHGPAERVPSGTA
jgi:hypothetical protein